MIRHAILLMLLVLGAQTQAQKLFDIGLKAGISKDDIMVDNVADHTAITGWHAGGFLRLKPPVAPGLQAELLYNNMGTDIRPMDEIPGHSEVRLQYLQVPLFLIFSLGPAELHLGVYGSKLMNASITQPMALYNEFQELRDDQFQDSDHGLLGGVGLRLGSFYAGARYTFGLGTIGASDNTILRNARNMQAQFYIAYGFN